MLTCLVPVLFTFYIRGVLKLKKIIPAPKGYLQAEASGGLRGADSSSAGGRCGGSGRQEISLPCRETRRPLSCEIWDSHSCIPEDSGCLEFDTSSIGKQFMINRNIYIYNLTQLNYIKYN